MDASYQERLGERLRSIRQQQGLTLQQVEDKSNGHWKAVVVGSYERGDRAVSVAKLADLAEFYGVPVSELLPPSEDGITVMSDNGERDLVLDLTRLRGGDIEPALRPIARYVASIQVQRGDYNGQMMSLRRDDVKSLAIILGVEPDELVARLEGRGVLC